MVKRHQMIWCPPGIRFSYNIINLHPWAVGVAISVGPANYKSTNVEVWGHECNLIISFEKLPLILHSQRSSYSYNFNVQKYEL